MSTLDQTSRTVLAPVWGPWAALSYPLRPFLFFVNPHQSFRVECAFLPSLGPTFPAPCLLSLDQTALHPQGLQSAGLTVCELSEVSR